MSATTTVTLAPNNAFDFYELQTFQRVEGYLQPVIPTVQGYISKGSQYYTTLKHHTAVGDKVLGAVEKNVTNVASVVGHKLQEQAQANKDKVEKLDQIGVSTLDKVEKGRIRVEELLLKPALLLLSWLQVLLVFLKGQSQETQQPRQSVSQGLVETYKEVGTVVKEEVAPEAVKYVKTQVKIWRPVVEETARKLPLASRVEPYVSTLLIVLSNAINKKTQNSSSVEKVTTTDVSEKLNQKIEEIEQIEQIEQEVEQQPATPVKKTPEPHSEEEEEEELLEDE